MLSRPSSSHPSADQVRPAPLVVDVSLADPRTVVVTPTGAADLCTVSGLEQVLRDALDPGPPHIVVDLDQLTFMDATTLGVLVDARLRLAAAGRTLHVRCHTAHRRRLLTLTGLDGMLDQGA